MSEKTVWRWPKGTGENQWQCPRCLWVFSLAELAAQGVTPDPDTGDLPPDQACPVCGARFYDLHGARRDVRATFARPVFFSRLVARLQWDPAVIDFTPDARAWPELPDERRQRLTGLLAGFCVAEDAVAEHLAPFAGATKDTMVAWVFFLQRRDEERHTQLFDRIAAEVLDLPGDTPEERRAAARELVTPELLELFEERLPSVAADLAAGHIGLADGISLYHMVLEGVVFSAGQKALLEDLEDGVLPGLREGIGRVELDERWHIGFGLRNLMEARPSPDLVLELMARARDAAQTWGDLVPDSTREYVTLMAHRRLAAAGLLEAGAAA